MHATVCNNHSHSPVHVHTSKEAFLGYTGNSFNEVLHMCVIVQLHANRGVLVPTQRPPNLVLAQQALYMQPDMNIYESVCMHMYYLQRLWIDKKSVVLKADGWINLPLRY